MVYHIDASYFPSLTFIVIWVKKKGRRRIITLVKTASSSDDIPSSDSILLGCRSHYRVGYIGCNEFGGVRWISGPS